MPKRAVCAALGCRRTVHSRSVCTLHYQRWANLEDKGDSPVSRIEAISNDPKLGQSNGRPTLDLWERRVHSDRYIQVKVPQDHMMARPDRKSGTWVLEHRMVMAEKLGRPLKRNEIVKHHNGDTTDNRPDNLYILGEFHAKKAPSN